MSWRTRSDYGEGLESEEISEGENHRELQMEENTSVLVIILHNQATPSYTHMSISGSN